jgi:hypothetical protein
MKKQLTLLEITDEKPMKEWAEKLMGERHQEAVDSLDFEGVSQETVFYISLEGKKYIAFYSEGEVIGPSDRTKKINQDHLAVMKSILVRKNGENSPPERVIGELLYNVKK